MNEENKIILYQDDNEITRVSVRFSDEDLWLTQKNSWLIYTVRHKENISMHIRNIYADKELDENRTYKKFLLVRQEGNRQVKRNIDHYNLDMIIALGYRVQSQVATRFRRWATQRLHEYIQKGFAMDDERLKQGGTAISVSCCNASGIFVAANAISISKSPIFMPQRQTTTLVTR